MEGDPDTWHQLALVLCPQGPGAALLPCCSLPLCPHAQGPLRAPSAVPGAFPGWGGADGQTQVFRGCLKAPGSFIAQGKSQPQQFSVLPAPGQRVSWLEG